MPVPFVHLHTHTSHSRPYGIMRIDHMLERATELGQAAMAITDSGVMGGVFDFHQMVRSLAIKPIIGMEVSITHGDDKNNQCGEPGNSHHLTLLARNATGYCSLCRLSTEGSMSLRREHPSIGRSGLERWPDGIIALSGCEQGEIPQLLLSGKKEQAEVVANRYRDMYGRDNFYLEVVPSNPERTGHLVRAMRELSDATGIPLVATANAHYVHPGQEAIQDLVRSIYARAFMDEIPERSEAGRYLKSAEEMLAALPGCEDTLKNTVRIAEMCSFELTTSNGFFPQMSVPTGESANDYLSRLCAEALHKHHGPLVPPYTLECFQREIANIEKKGLAEYFLAFKNLLDLARRKGVVASAGNGAIAGSMVASLLGLTDIDPLAHGLFPECFLNNDLVPEIELFLEIGGKKIIFDNLDDIFDNHLHAAITAYGRYHLRSGIANAGPVLDAPPEQVDSLVKMIPDSFIIRAKDTSLQTALDSLPVLRDAYAASPSARHILDVAGSLDGIVRSTNTTGCYVMVTDQAAADYLPLTLLSGVLATQYDANTLRKMGVNRISIFESDALAIVKKTIYTIWKTRGVQLDVQGIPFDDQSTYAMLARGESEGVVHMETSGFRRFLTRFRPASFSEFTAMIAIYRPMGLHVLDGFVTRKHDGRPVTYPHPAMESILGETYGKVLYYEQIIALAVTLASFEPADGDRMCRALVRRDVDTMAAYHEKFIGQALNGIATRDASRIFTHVADSAKHCYSKARSVCAAKLAYQCASLKCHYPEEYMGTANGVGSI